ncbi:MAG: SAM-dependent methyltransferase [Prosthecobacter sp.]|nr:SAM-dependent methyltransferase [Prosthecobacter sp.]
MTPLTDIVLARLAAAQEGFLPFVDVMELALYHPVHGYYGPAPRRIGRTGDFFTSVSVGPLYGRLLATLAGRVRQEMGSPRDFALIEQGAHDGQLGADILMAADDFASYWIVEPNPAYQGVQRERLAAWGGRVNWVTSLADLPPVPALYLCNELPDAMPVHLVRWSGRNWEEICVQRGEAGGLDLTPGPLSSPRLTAEVQRLPADLPPGYTTEVNLAALDWMGELAVAPFRGAVYIADYGLDAAELYSPERTTGTLRRYFDHRTDNNVLENLGDSDLTTHVNFTRLIEAAESAGLRLRTYEHQGRFLGKLGLEWLATLEGQPPDAATQALLRQYQSLTHPAFMGRSFRVLMLDK